MSGAQAERLLAGRERVRGRARRVQAGQARHDRQVACDRHPADGPYALDLARRTDGSIDSVSDDEIRAGIKLLAETTGVFTETAGGVNDGDARQARRNAARSTATSASCSSSPARG